MLTPGQEPAHLPPDKRPSWRSPYGPDPPTRAHDLQCRVLIGSPWRDGIAEDGARLRVTRQSSKFWRRLVAATSSGDPSPIFAGRAGPEYLNRIRTDVFLEGEQN